MNFLVDAQLPQRVIQWLTAAGCDACHTLDLPEGNRTTDAKIAEIANAEDRILITKDADFVNSHLLFGRPAKLLLISIGNISNGELQKLLLPLIPQLCAELGDSNFVELTRNGIVTR